MRLRNCTLMVSVALMMTSGFAGLCAGEDIAIREEGSFPATFLGGGDYVLAKAPAGDSWIAVVYGTGNQTVKGPITIVAMWDRTLAGAEVYDSDGKVVRYSFPVKARSILVHQFDALIEFNDTSGDGIGNIARSPQPVAADQLMAREPVYKAVSLRRVWNRDAVSESTTVENGTTVKTFSFNLTATGLDYFIVGNTSPVDPAPGDGVLNRVTFGFNLKVFTAKGTVSVPFYNMTVHSGYTPWYNLTRLPDRTYNITTFSARAKTDHTVEGWDFDPDNSHPRLLLESGTRMGISVSAPDAEIRHETYKTGILEGGGKMNYTIDGGKPGAADPASGRLIWDTAPADANDTPVKLGRNEVLISDLWQKCGWLAWSPDVKAQDNETAAPRADSAFFEVQGARQFKAAIFRNDSSYDRWFFGVQLLAGLSYPGAWRVVHDPELGVDMGSVDIPEFGPPPNHAPCARIISPREGKEFTTTENVRLDGTSCSDEDNDTLSFGWTEGTRSLGNSSIISRKFPEGRHRVSLTIHDGRGGFDTATVNFTVKKESTPGFGAAAAAPALVAAAVLAAILRRRS